MSESQTELHPAPKEGRAYIVPLIPQVVYQSVKETALREQRFLGVMFEMLIETGLKESERPIPTLSRDDLKQAFVELDCDFIAQLKASAKQEGRRFSGYITLLLQRGLLAYKEANPD